MSNQLKTSLSLRVLTIVLFSLAAFANPQSGLLFHLPLDGKLNDAGPLHLKCKSTGGKLKLCRDRKGKLGGALMFGPGAITVDNPSKINNLKAFTLAAWIYPVERSAHSNIISKVTPNRDFNLQLDDKGRLGSHSAEGSTYQWNYSKKPIPLKKWTHVAVTYKDLTWKMYVNGQFVSERKAEVAPPWSGGSLSVGAVDSGGNEPFHGGLDDVRIYKTALDAAQIKALAK